MIWGNKVSVDNNTLIHTHHMDELVVCHNNEGRHQVRAELFPVRPGRVFYLPAGVLHGVHGTPEHPTVITYVCFTAQEIDTLLTPTLPYIIRSLRDQKRYVTPDEDNRQVELAERITPELGEIHPVSQAMAGALLSEMLLRFARAVRQEVEWRDRREQKIAACCRLIRADCRQSYRLEDLARKAGMCRTLFCRLFREVTGTTFNRFVLNQRIAGAMQLLQHSGLPVTEVALRCGFENLSHFHRQFKKHTHKTPQGYRSFIREQGTAVY